MSLNITNVRVTPLKNTEGNTLAMCSIEVDNSLVINDIKVVNGKNGNFVGMPSRKAADGTYKDIVLSTDKQNREELQAVILKAYEAALKGSKPEVKGAGPVSTGSRNSRVPAEYETFTKKEAPVTQVTGRKPAGKTAPVIDPFPTEEDPDWN